MPCSFEISCPFPEERWHSHLPSQRDLESSDFSDTFWSPASVSHHSPVPFWVTDNVFFSKTITVVLHNTNTCWKQECWSGVPSTASSSLLFLPLVYQQKPQSRSALLPHKDTKNWWWMEKIFLCLFKKKNTPLVLCAQAVLRQLVMLSTLISKPQNKYTAESWDPFDKWLCPYFQ